MTEPTPAAPAPAAPSVPAGEQQAAPPASPPTSPQPGTAPGVSAAAAVLDAIGERPLHEHPDAYGRIHAELHGALTSIDDA